MAHRAIQWLSTPVGQRVGAVAVFLAVAWLFYYLTHVPVARPLDPAAPWAVEAGDRLVMRPLGPATVLTVEGADNEGVDIRFDDALLDPATVDSLRRDFDLGLPATRGPIAWTTRVRSSGHTTIEVALQPEGPAPEVRMWHVGAAAHPGIAIQAADARLLVRFAVLLGGDGPVQAPEQKVLRIGAAPPLELPGAIPLAAIVPSGRRFTLTFPVERPASTLRVGESLDAEAGGGLPLRDAGVLRGDSGYRLYACAAGENAHFLLPRKLGSSDCSAGGELRALGLTLTSSSLALSVRGSGFIASDGVALSDNWLEKLQKNVPFAVLFGLAFAALGKWVWGAFASRPKVVRAPAGVGDSGE